MADRATEQWTRCRLDELAVASGCRFDERAAERVRTFFSRFLRHSKGQWAGKPFDLQPWQWERLIAPLFGWKRADGTRRYRKAGVWIPKKNGKSALASGVSLYLLVADGEAGAEVYNFAADRNQASIVFDEAVNMVEASEGLLSRLDVLRSTKRIVYPGQAAFYRAMSAEAPTKEGLNWHGFILDELHAQHDRVLYDTLRYGGRARRQPLELTISTAGFDRHSIGYEQYQYAKGVAEDRIEDLAFLPLIYEAEVEDDWTAEEVWRKANPSLGVTVTVETFRQDCVEAQASPAKENAFRRYLLNQWTEQDVRWLQLARWDACATPVNPDDLEGRECYAGLDLSSTTDLTALALLFPDDQGGYDLLCFFWVPEEGARKREKTDRVPYRQWIKAGLIEATPGDTVDQDLIRRRIGELGNKYQIREIAIDRWNATQITTQLMGDGFEVIAFGQGFASMSSPTKELESLVLAGKLRHGGNPVLRWCAGNVSVEQDAAENLKPSKKKSVERIDGVVAAVMALGRAMVRSQSGDGGVEFW